MKPVGAVRLEIVPIEFDEACAFVEKHHRHHKPPHGHRFSVAVARPACEGFDPNSHEAHRWQVVGVAIVGRPVSKAQQDGWTVEVLRNCTDGTPNACSALYGACRRAAFTLGYRRVITYLLASELGISPRAAGFRFVGIRKGGNWNKPSRPRVDTAAELRGQKQLWEVMA